MNLPVEPQEFFSDGGEALVDNKELESMLLDPLLDAEVVLSMILYHEGIRKFVLHEQLVGNFDWPEQRVKHEYDHMLKIKGIFEATGTPYGISFLASKGIRINDRLDRYHVSSYMTGGIYEDIISTSTQEFGRLYNYPECCIEYFVECHEKGVLPQNFNKELLKKPLEEIFKLKELGYILHQPCSAGCKETWNLATQYMNLCRGKYPKIAEEIEKEGVIKKIFSLFQTSQDF